MTWNNINLPYLNRLSLESRQIQTLLSLLFHISVPRLQSLSLNILVDSDKPLTAEASNGIKTHPPIYGRLLKLELRVYMDKHLPHIFDRVNSLIDNSAPVLEHLHLCLWADYRRSKTPKAEYNLTNVVVIRTPMKVTLDVYDGDVDMDKTLSCLGEGTGMEELLTQYYFPVENLQPAKDKYHFPHLRTLVLRGKLVHPLADHIYGPLLMPVKLEKSQRD
jgi:hypothetical protein